MAEAGVLRGMEKIAGGGFEQKWREIAPVVERALARRGVPQWLRDDVMQETALRLYRFWGNVDPKRSTLPLAMTIANNALRDEHSRRSRCEIPGTIPDAPFPTDVENAGLARVELKRVRDVLGRLSPSYRSVLLAEVGCAPVPQGGTDATKMLRLRARKKMRSLLESASAGAFVLALPRSLWRSFRGARRTIAPTGASAAVAAAWGLVAIFGMPGAAPVHVDPRSLTTQPRVVLAHVQQTAESDRSAAPPGSMEPSTRGDRRPNVRAAGAEPEPGSYWEVGLGDEETPVQGEATVQITDDPAGHGIRPPSCSVDRPSEDVVEAHCEADAGDQHVKAQARIRVGP